MADTKLSALTAQTGAGAATGDLVETVDISDTTMAASGTNKKMTLAELVIFLNANGISAATAANKICIVNLSAGQSVAPNVLVPIAWTSERSDLEGWHAANSTDIVVPVGTYVIAVQWAWDVVTSGTRFHHLEVTESGVTSVIAAQALDPSSAFGDTTGNMVVTYVAAASAAIRVQVYQTAATSVTFGSVSGVLANRPLASAGTSANAEFSVTQLNGVGTGGVGGLTGVVVKEDGVTTSAAATGLDFGNGIDVGTGATPTVVVDLGEYSGGNLPNTKVAGLGSLATATTAQARSLVASGAGALFGFDFDTTTTAGPGATALRLNNATPASATAVFINYTSKDGVDLKTRLAAGTAGDRLYIQDRANSANWRLYELTGAPVDNTTYATCNVVYRSGAGSLWANATELIGGFMAAAITIGTVAPLSPLTNDIWIDTN